MQALRRQLSQCSNEQVEFFGVGGDRMLEAGCELLADAREIAEVGIVEVVQRIPRIYRRFREVVSAARDRRPDAAVLIDFPDFNLRLARELHKLDVPVIYYVSPQLWAWKQGRIERVRKYVREMLVIFPFEEKFYRDRGIAAEFVGHPLADLPAPTITREDFAAEYNLDLQRPWIALLPGSRRGEVSRIFPTLLEAAKLLGPDYVYIVPVASTLDSAWVSFVLAELFRTACHPDPRRAGHTAPRPGCGRRQRHLDAGSIPDRHAFRHGLSGRAAHLERRTTSSKGGPLCDGQSDRGEGCRPRTRPGRLYAGASID